MSRTSATASRVAVIAGATRGIGFALTRALARAWESSDQIYLTARHPADGQAAVDRLVADGLSVGWLPFDLADPASPEALALALRDRHGGVDVALLNGAYMPRAGGRQRQADDRRQQPWRAQLPAGDGADPELDFIEKWDWVTAWLECGRWFRHGRFRELDRG